MKCIHCGWDNQDQETHCVKCGHVLERSVLAGDAYSAETITGASAERKAGASTVVSRAGGGSSAGTIKDRVPGDLSGETAPSAGAAVETIDPHRQPLTPREFYLSRWDARDQDPVILSFSTPEDHFEFNRANLDPANNTITSKVQAEITFTDGKWQIRDRSEKKSTFIQVSESHELQQGDILLIGNKRFIFSTIHPKILMQRT